MESADLTSQVADMRNDDLNKITKWVDQWLVSFIPYKSQSLIVSNKMNKLDHPDSIFSETVLITIDHHKHLGIIFFRRNLLGRII